VCQDLLGCDWEGPPLKVPGKFQTDEMLNERHSSTFISGKWALVQYRPESAPSVSSEKSGKEMPVSENETWGETGPLLLGLMFIEEVLNSGQKNMELVGHWWEPASEKNGYYGSLWPCYVRSKTDPKKRATPRRREPCRVSVSTALCCTQLASPVTHKQTGMYEKGVLHTATFEWLKQNHPDIVIEGEDVVKKVVTSLKEGSGDSNRGDLSDAEEEDEMGVSGGASASSSALSSSSAAAAADPKQNQRRRRGNQFTSGSALRLSVKATMKSLKLGKGKGRGKGR